MRKEILATARHEHSTDVLKPRRTCSPSLTPDKLPAFNIGIRIVIGIAAVIGFLVMFQAMYTAVMERTREIGVLKSLGASKLYVVSIVLARNRTACNLQESWQSASLRPTCMRIVLQQACSRPSTSIVNSHLGLRGCGHCLLRLDNGRVIPGFQGRQQRPHRRALLRVEPGMFNAVESGIPPLHRLRFRHNVGYGGVYSRRYRTASVKALPCHPRSPSGLGSSNKS